MNNNKRYYSYRRNLELFKFLLWVQLYLLKFVILLVAATKYL